MSALSEKEMDEINARVEARKVQNQIETEHYWKITYPAMSYDDRIKVWERQLWFAVRNGDYGRKNMNYLNKDYLYASIDKEPNIVKMYDEILQNSDWIDEEFGDGTVNIIRNRIIEDPNNLEMQ